jgi:hypothetical protein
MNFVALKMLVGDRAKYLGIVMGLTFASLLITQQAGIFVGLMSRTYGAITDASGPDVVWVRPSSLLVRVDHKSDGVTKDALRLSKVLAYAAPSQSYL